MMREKVGYAESQKRVRFRQIPIVDIPFIIHFEKLV